MNFITSGAKRLLAWRSSGLTEIEADRSRIGSRPAALRKDTFHRCTFSGVISASRTRFTRVIHASLPPVR